MSEFKSVMSTIKEKERIVYMILYNYEEYGYSVVKIMNNLNDAYKYICDYEFKTGIIEKFKMIKIKNIDDFSDSSDEADLNICYFKNTSYSSFCLVNFENVSQMLISEMTIC